MLLRSVLRYRIHQQNKTYLSLIEESKARNLYFKRTPNQLLRLSAVTCYLTAWGRFRTVALSWTPRVGLLFILQIIISLLVAVIMGCIMSCPYLGVCAISRQRPICCQHGAYLFPVMEHYKPRCKKLAPSQ